MPDKKQNPFHFILKEVSPLEAKKVHNTEHMCKEINSVSRGIIKGKLCT